jgi:hypothetical protein
MGSIVATRPDESTHTLLASAWPRVVVGTAAGAWKVAFCRLLLVASSAHGGFTYQAVPQSLQKMLM